MLVARCGCRPVVGISTRAPYKHQRPMMTPCFSSGQELLAFSADNRPLFAVPRVLQTEEEGAALVVLDLLPRVRYRVPLDLASDAPLATRFCFESGLLICPDSQSPSTTAVVINLSDRMASLCSGSWGPPPPPSPHRLSLLS